MTSTLKTIVTIAYTYWTKNKGRSAEGVLVKITRVLSVLFIALSLVLCTNWLD